MSFLESLASALGTAGDVLDTPAAMLRSAMVGQNPLTAALDTSKRLTTRDVLERYGVLGPDQEGLDPGDMLAGGLGLVLDPMNLVGGLGIWKNLARMKGLASSNALGATPGFTDDAIKAFFGRAVQRYSPAANEEALMAWKNSLLPDERAGLRTWSGMDFKNIQRAYRGAGNFEGMSSPYAIEMAKILDATDPSWRMSMKPQADAITRALSRYELPEDTLLFRSAADNEAARWGVGRTVTNRGLTSTSISPGEATGYYGANASPENPIFDVLAPKGYNAGYLSKPVGLANADYEKEMLLPAGAKFRVLAKRDIPVVASSDGSTPYWFRGTSFRDIDPMFRAKRGEVLTDTQPNYLIEAIPPGIPSLGMLARHHLPSNPTLIAALTGHHGLRTVQRLNDPRGFDGNDPTFQ